MEVTQKPHLHQDWIDPHAYGIVKALQKAGHETYLVGGCVRDLLVGIHPKDFDIATMAHPPEVKKLIYMAFIIGRRFRLVLVKREDQQFEVATFRKDFDPNEAPEGTIPNENVFGTPEEDAKRRDFTINGLFYDPIQDQLIDFVEGLKDIESRDLRMIGDPNIRLLEDPIRILRALRLAHKIGFHVEPNLRASIQKNAAELSKSILPRRREEILKILRLPEPELCLLEAHDLGALKHVMPTLDAVLADPEKCHVFLDFFRRFHAMAPASADTVHLFGWLVFSYFRTVVNPEDDPKMHHIIEEERFQNFMREELGMFKFEQLSVSRALEVLQFLPRRQEFEKRGPRRQFAILKNEGFALGLQMASVDYIIDGETLMYWRQVYEDTLPLLEQRVVDMKSKKKSQRRRRQGRKPMTNLDG